MWNKPTVKNKALRNTLQHIFSKVHESQKISSDYVAQLLHALNIPTEESCLASSAIFQLSAEPCGRRKTWSVATVSSSSGWKTWKNISCVPWHRSWWPGVSIISTREVHGQPGGRAG